MTVPYTEYDDESALDKLRQVALRWDSSSFSTTKGFEQMLSPLEFKAQLEKTFNIPFTPQEVP